MMTREVIACDCARPDWPFVPVSVVCGSARTICVTGLRSPGGVTLTGCRVRVTNADGVALTLDCVRDGGAWCATFPASHFASFGTVKNGVVVFAVGTDERGNEQLWIVRVGDLRVLELDASTTGGGTSAAARDVYLKAAIIDGVQHYKREVLVYSERQRAWGAEYVGDYVFVAGEFVPFDEEEKE